MTVKPSTTALVALPVTFSQAPNFALPAELAPPSSSVGIVIFMHWLKHTSRNAKACRIKMQKIKKADEQMKSAKEGEERRKAMKKLCKLTTAGLKPSVARNIMIHATCLHTYPYITEIPKGERITNLMIEHALFLNKKKKNNRRGWKQASKHVVR